MYFRDVTTAATGATAVAPKFSDTLTLFQPGGGRFCPPLARSHLDFPRGYVPVFVWQSYFGFFFYLVGIASGKTNKFNSSIKRIWSAYIGQAAATCALTGAIPLLLAASTLSCWMSPLARIALPQTTWPPRVPPECPC